MPISQYELVGVEIMTVINNQITCLWDVTPSVLVDTRRRLEGNCLLSFQKRSIFLTKTYM
jgi:hypothetical protein